MSNSQQGLSIIEFIIIYIFVSVFLSLAIPTLEEFFTRRHVSVAMGLTEVAKMAVSKAAAANERLPENQQETGYVSPKPSWDVVSIEIANDGSGEVTLTTTPAAGGGTVIFTPDYEPGKPIKWDCSGGTLEDKYRPPECF